MVDVLPERLLNVTTLKSIFLGHPEFFDGLPIWAIGLAFDPKTHRLVDAAAEKLL